jgi:hypothetical protein
MGRLPSSTFDMALGKDSACSQTMQYDDRPALEVLQAM